MNLALPDVHTLTDVLALIGDGILLGLASVLRNPYGVALVVVLVVIITATLVADWAATKVTDYDDPAPFLTDEQRQQHMRDLALGVKGRGRGAHHG